MLVLNYLSLVVETLYEATKCLLKMFQLNSIFVTSHLHVAYILKKMGDFKLHMSSKNGRPQENGRLLGVGSRRGKVDSESLPDITS